MRIIAMSSDTWPEIMSTECSAQLFLACPTATLRVVKPVKVIPYNLYVAIRDFYFYEIFILLLKILLIMKNRCCTYRRLRIKIGADATARMVKVRGSITHTNIKVYDL